MRKPIVLILTSLIVIGVFITQVIGNNNKDEAAIKITVLNYLEGWYEGSGERMDKALHPDLTKKAILIHPETGKIQMPLATKENMVEWTKRRKGKKDTRPWKENIKITVQDIYTNCASVKAISLDYCDYIHLAKIDGEWVIMQVLWEPAKK